MTFGIDSHRPLTTNEKGAIIAGLTLIAPHAVLAAGRGWKTLGLIRKGITSVLIPTVLGPGLIGPMVPDLHFLGPGGGGPGQSPISTNPPLSVREQGRAMAEAGKYGRTPSPSVGKEGRASRRQCPYNFTGGKWHLGGWYTKTRQCTRQAGHSGRHRKPAWMRK